MTNKERLFNNEPFRIRTLEDFINEKLPKENLEYYRYLSYLNKKGIIQKYRHIDNKWTWAYYCCIEKISLKSIKTFHFHFDIRVIKIIRFNDMIFDYAEQCSTN